MIRVLVCENRELVLSGIRSVTNETSDVEVVGQVSAPSDLPAAIRRLRPDVLLISAVPPAVGVAEIRTLLDHTSGSPPLVVITADPDEEIIDMLLDGVRGALLADSEPADIVSCIRMVAAGSAMLAPPIAGKLLDLIGGAPQFAPTPPPALAALTDREREVLSLLAVGKSYADIAAELSISTATVRSHVHHVVAKLNLRHPTHAITLAYQVGLVSAHR